MPQDVNFQFFRENQQLPSAVLIVLQAFANKIVCLRQRESDSAASKLAVLGRESDFAASKLAVLGKESDSAESQNNHKTELSPL